MAKAAYFHRGEALDYENSGSTLIAAGTIVVYGTKIGIVGGDIPAGGKGAIHVAGVFEMPKEASLAVDAGAAVYWDATNSVITTTSTSNTLAGYAVKAALGTDDKILVKINA